MPPEAPKLKKYNVLLSILNKEENYKWKFIPFNIHTPSCPDAGSITAASLEWVSPSSHS